MKVREGWLVLCLAVQTCLFTLYYLSPICFPLFYTSEILFNNLNEPVLSVVLTLNEQTKGWKNRKQIYIK